METENIPEPKSLQQQFDNLFELYGERNALYLRGDLRFAFFLSSVGIFNKSIRNNQSKEVLNQNLAVVFARSSAYADSFVRLPVIEALCRKYPAGNCAFCGNFPCTSCGHKRTQNITLSEILPEQMQWSISQWINHMGNLYGKNNRERGLDKALLRLYEEIIEAMNAHHFDNLMNPTRTARQKDLAHEFADLFAWIFSIANLLDLDIEDAIKARYWGVCHKCGERPCNCGPLHTASVNSIISE